MSLIHKSNYWSSPISIVSAAVDRGTRERMEDFIKMSAQLNFENNDNDEASILPNSENETFSYFAVFDGHGGDQASKYLRNNFHDFLGCHPSIQTDVKTALSETFNFADHKFFNSRSCTSDLVGSTATVVLISPTTIYTSWVGDSEAFLFKNGGSSASIVKITNPHIPSREDERKRIENSGGYVAYRHKFGRNINGSKSIGRVNGKLAVSRAIGNFMLKELIISKAEITEQFVDGSLSFIVLASDGLWVVMKPEEIRQAIIIYLSHCKNMEQKIKKMKTVGSHLIDLALKKASHDNISVIVIFFQSSELFDLSDDDSCSVTASDSIMSSFDINSKVSSDLTFSESGVSINRKTSLGKKLKNSTKIAYNKWRRILLFY